MTYRSCYITCKCGAGFYSQLLENGKVETRTCERCKRREIFKKAIAFLLDKPASELLELRKKYYAKKHREETVKCIEEQVLRSQRRSSARSAKCNSEEESSSERTQSVPVVRRIEK